MRIFRVVCLLAALALVGGCACRTKKVGAAEAETNVPVARVGMELKDVNFAFDSSELDANARALLKENARWLQENSGARVQIEGHCDERGTNEYNMALGMRRARAAYDFVRSLGISESRMSTVSYGEELPLDPGHNEAAWARNRRAHFNIQK